MSFFPQSQNIQINGGHFVAPVPSPDSGADRKEGRGRLISKGKNPKWETHGLKKGDVVFKYGKPDDIIIPVMGPTGTGKSTFINTLLGEDLALVGHDFASGTSQIRHFVQNIPNEFSYLQGRRLIVVDTPGFDDIHITDAEILRRISAWLAYSYAADMTIGGVVYLEDISQSRMHPSSRRNVEIFRNLCGAEALSAIFLTTTKWGEIKDEIVGITRETQLHNSLWKDLIAAGSSVCRFQNTRQSAWSIVNKILHKVENTNNIQALQIQGEVVDFRRRLSETQAGKVLRMKLRDLRAMQQGRAKEQWATGDDSEGDKIKQLENQIEALKIGLPRRILILIGLA